MIFIDLIYNLSLLVALSVISGFIGKRWKHKLQGNLLQGFIFGSAAVIGMLRPLVLAPGLIFDGRSVMISLCGLFFGTPAASVAGTMALICRILQGGVGSSMGVCVILSSALVGVYFHFRWIHRDGEVTAMQLFGFSMIVHVMMLALISLLPSQMVLPTLKRIGLPVILTYPLATVLIGKILSDQQARERSRKIMKRAKERFKMLVNNAPFGMVLIGRDTSFVIINPKFRETFGYDESDIPNGRAWFEKAFPEPEYRRKVIAAWIDDEKHAQAGEQRPRIFTVTCKNGEKKVTSFIPVALSNHEQMMTTVDITRDVEMEERFRQAERLESVGRLAAGVAHDLNNMLSPILGNAELILIDQDPSSKIHRRAQGIIHAAERSRDLIAQLLAFGRKQMLVKQSLDMRQIVEDIKKLIHRTIRENIRVETIQCAEPCPVSADPGRIGQILMNLCVNAQDAMPDGGILTIQVNHVRVGEDRSEKVVPAAPGPYVLLSVSDTGCGIDKETQQHIFEPFFTTKNELGTGLGLATVYGIVKQHEGYIQVISEPDKGTAFKIYLPMLPVKLAETKAPVPPRNGMRGSETILVVEDNEMTRDVASSILKHLGYTVFTAASGNEALNFLDTPPEAVDLLLTDVVMPDMDGKTLYEKITRSHPDIRVLFMSGYARNTIARHGVLEEGIPFIHKPFTIETLAAKVRETLNRMPS
jgi:PAS domain S-box-containing protein